MSDDLLQPIEQKEIEFYGDNVIAVRMEDGTVYVPVKPLCELIGVDWASQRQRINRDEILSRHKMSVVITTSDIDPTSRRPKTSRMLALPLSKLNGWLFGMSPSRVKKSIKATLLKYQEECYDVLFEAFGKNTVAVRHDDELMQSADPMAVAYRQSLAIAKIAREHYYLARRVDNHESRLQLIEANLGNDKRYVTKEQASHISQGVRAIGTVLSKRSGKNEYGGVYGELYRTWSVSSYKEIAAVKYDDVVAWLRNWYLELVDDSDCPF